MTVVLVARYHTVPGKADTVAAALATMAERVAADEPGCLLYQANRSTEVEDTFLLYEVYADEAALAAHRETPHFLEIVEGQVAPLLDKRERELYAPVPS